MKVVFLEDVPGTARIGDIKEVKAGFARNYLLPRRMAMAATPSVIKSAEARAVRETRLQDARDTEARAIASKVESAAISITARAGSTGKLFGSVGTNDIAEKVTGIIGQEFDRHNVVLAEPIKDLGDYEVPVKFTKNVTVTAHVSVIGEDGTTAADIRKKADAAKGGATPTAAAEAGDDAADAPGDAEAPIADAAGGAEATDEGADADAAEEADEPADEE